VLAIWCMQSLPGLGANALHLIARLEARFAEHGICVFFFVSLMQSIPVRAQTLLLG